MAGRIALRSEADTGKSQEQGEVESEPASSYDESDSADDREKI